MSYGNLGQNKLWDRVRKSYFVKKKKKTDLDISSWKVKTVEIRIC